MKKIFLLLAMLLACTMLAACVPNYSNGDRLGIVTKLSEKGLVFKSWEGEMLMGGVRVDSEGNSGANIFTFNVREDQVPAVQAAMNHRIPVKLHYHQWFISPFTQNSDYTITNVEQATP